MLHPRQRGRALVAIAAIGLSLLAACGDDNKDTASQPGSVSSTARPTVGVAFVGARTGDNANLGINIYNGALLAVDQANAKGDLPVTLALKPFDTQGDPAQAQTLKDQIVADSQIVGIVGPAFTGESNAANPTFDAAGLALVTPSASNPSLSTHGWKVFHRIIANDEVQSKEQANYLAKGLKAGSIAFIHDNSDYGKGLADLSRSATEAVSIKTDMFEAVDAKGTDYSVAVNKIKAAGSPVVFYGGYYNEFGRLVKQLRDAGVTATLISGDGSKDPGFVTSAGEAASEGALATCACADPTVATDSAAMEFTAAYQAKFGSAPGTYSAEGFDAANLMIESIRKGGITRPAVLDYLNNKLGTFKGLTKDITFLENGEIATGSVYVYEYKGGKVTVKGTTTDLAQ